MFMLAAPPNVIEAGLHTVNDPSASGYTAGKNSEI